MSWPKNIGKVIISGLLVEITADGYQTLLLLKCLPRLDPPIVWSATLFLKTNPMESSDIHVEIPFGCQQSAV